MVVRSKSVSIELVYFKPQRRVVAVGSEHMVGGMDGAL